MSNPLELLALLSAAIGYGEQTDAENHLRRQYERSIRSGYQPTEPERHELAKAAERRAASEDGVRRAALAYAAALLERRFDAERVPPFHVGHEPSAFDAIAYLKQSAGES